MECTSQDLWLETNTVVAGSELEDFSEAIERRMHEIITKAQMLFFEKRDLHVQEMEDELEAVLPRLPELDKPCYAEQLEAGTIELVQEAYRTLEQIKEETRFQAHQLLRAAMQFEAEK